MRRCIIWLAFLFVATTAKADYRFLGPVQEWRREGQTVWLTTAEAKVRIDVVSANIFRIRLAPAGEFERDHSYAVVSRDWPPVPFQVTDGADTLTLRTTSVELRIAKSPARLEFRDARTGLVINRDAPAFGMGWNGPRVIAFKQRLRDDVGLERYYGLGEKTRGLDKGGNLYTMWNSDIPGYDGRTDPLYQSIPFYIGLHHGIAYGIYFDNTYRSEFNMGAGNALQLMSFGAEGGELDYYFIYGPGMKDVVRRYTLLTGRPPLPPLWALGYQQSRWSYYPEAEVRRIAATFREKQIPADVLYLDIHYMDGYRVFTWDPERFPNPKKLLADLAADGFKVVVIIDPGIKVDTDYWVCRDGLAGDHFSKLPDGSLFTAEVWPGVCYFPDFTRPKTRTWWGTLFRGLIEDGIAGFWNDMNEPGVWGGTFPPIVMHDNDGQPVNHPAVHNVWGMQMVRSTYEGVRRLRPEERPFVLTRAGFAGEQRYTAVWTGDNVASWDHLRLSLPMLLNLGLSGVPFVGSDVGGFIDTPTPELFVRWIQLGALTPLFRTHTAYGTTDQEPWSFGDRAEDISRKFIGLRYQLLPYIYKEFEQSTRTGLPLMRPLVLEFQHDSQTYWTQDEFLLGDDLLVAPVLEEGARVRRVYLPEGRWLHWGSDSVYVGPGSAWVEAALESMPIFLREGAVLPTWPVMNHVGERPVDPLTLDVFPGASASRDTLYEDDGRSFAYLDGGYARTPVELSRNGRVVRLRIGQRLGSYVPAPRSYRLRFRNQAAEPNQVLLSGRRLRRFATVEMLMSQKTGWAYDAARKVVYVVFPDKGEEVVLRVGK
jgi:alpha-glucosidase